MQLLSTDIHSVVRMPVRILLVFSFLLFTNRILGRKKLPVWFSVFLKCGLASGKLKRHSLAVIIKSSRHGSNFMVFGCCKVSHLLCLISDHLNKKEVILLVD